MSVTISQVNSAAGADTFQIWVNRTNETINAISTVAVTVNTHANGGLTTGNGFVEGTFGGRNLVANTVRGGTVQTPGTLTIISNVAVTGTTINIGTVTVNSTMVTIGGANVALEVGGAQVNAVTTGTTAQLVDSWSKTLYRGAEYTLTVKDNNANNHQISRVLVIHDTGDAYLTHHGILWSNTSAGNYSANADATSVRVYFTPVSTNTNVKGSRSLVVV